MKKKSNLTTEEMKQQLEEMTAQFEGLKKADEQQKAKLEQVCRKREVLKNLADTLTKTNTDLKIQLECISKRPPSTRRKGTESYEMKFSMLIDEIGQAKEALQEPKSEYKLLKQRLNYLKNCWEEKENEYLRQIAEYEMNIDLTHKKNEEIKKRMKTLIQLYPNQKTPPIKDLLEFRGMGNYGRSDPQLDPMRGRAMDSVKDELEKLETAVTAKSIELRNLQATVRSLQQKRDLLRKKKNQV